MSDGGGYFGGDSGEGPGRRRVLPEGFADIPAGPRLGVLVASIDRRACNGFELEEVIRAHRRQVCWQEAQCLAAVNELAHTTPGMPDEPAERSDEPDSMTQVVLESLLRWSGHHADWFLDLALTLPRLPRVRDALATGQLDLPEVRTIVDRITDADPDLWGAIEDALFPKVLELRGGLLRAKVEAEVVKADPDAAAKRHKAKRSDRDVAIWPAIDGVADLSIRGLSADQAAEAYGYIDAIARAVKSTGDPRTLSQLRADIAYSLLSGTADLNDCSAPTVTAHQGESAQTQAVAQEEAAQDEAEPDRSAQDETEAQAGQDDCVQDDCVQDDSGPCAARDSGPQGQANPEAADEAAGYTGAEADCETPAEGESEQQSTGQAEGDTAQGGQGHCGVHRFPDHDLHDSWCECGDCSPAPVPSCSVCGGAARHGVPVHDTAAHHAARNAADHNAAAEYAAEDGADPPGQSDPPDPVDPPGQPGPAKDKSTPPTPPPWTSLQPSWGPIRTRAKIQLNMPLTTLMGLSARPGELGGLGPIVTEVAERLIANNLTNPEARFSVGITHPVTGRLLHLHPIPARFLRGLQAELVHARDQRCVWTTCRRPAATCHLDHNAEYADGGETSVDNIAPLCPRHHKAKTERDWKLQQIGPGGHTLTDPFGRQYTSGAPSLTDPAPPEPATAAGTKKADGDLPPF